jgi:hypothetical protein
MDLQGNRKELRESNDDATHTAQERARACPIPHKGYIADVELSDRRISTLINIIVESLKYRDIT